MKKTTLIFTAIATLTAISNARAIDDYQYKVLFNPSEAQLEAEARGRIMIYDGLQLADVNRAMDGHYDRIENMMFVRTVHVQENGEYEVDDDCD